MKHVTDSVSPSSPLIGIYFSSSLSLLVSLPRLTVASFVYSRKFQHRALHSFLSRLYVSIPVFMGLAVTRVCTPLRIQTAKITARRSSWSFLVPLFSFGMGNCFDWPLRTVGLFPLRCKVFFSESFVYHVA